MRRAARPLLYAGIAGIVLGLGQAHARAIGHYDFTASGRLAWAIAYAALLAVAAYGFGLPEVVGRARTALGPSVSAAAAAALGISVVQLIAGDALLPRFVVFGAAAAVVPWAVMCSAIAAGGRTRAEERDRVVAVVTELDAGRLRRELASDPERPATIVAAMTPAGARATPDGGFPLVDAVVRSRGNVVVLDREAQGDDTIVRQVAGLHEAGIRVRTLSLFYEEWLGKLPLAELGRVSLMFDIGEVHRLRYGRVKRVLDVVVAIAGLVPLAAVTPFVVVGNAIANRGPLFFRQPRVGRNGDVFSILKFRTMRPGGAGSEWTGPDDPRLTPFGRLLRRAHLDELPQVVNILRGELSTVGPRPEQPAYVKELSRTIPFYDLRLLVRPGLTGWAQVKYSYGASPEDAWEKLQYEFFYLRHQRLALDARIVGRTIRSVVGRRGR